MPRKHGTARTATTLSTIAYLVSGNFKVITTDVHQGYKLIDSKPGFVLWNENLIPSNDLYSEMGLTGLDFIQKAKRYLDKTCREAVNTYGNNPEMKLCYKEIVFAKCWDNYLYYPIAYSYCNCNTGYWYTETVLDMSNHIESKRIPHYHSMSTTYVAKNGAELYKYINEQGKSRVTPYKGKYKGQVIL